MPTIQGHKVVCVDASCQPVTYTVGSIATAIMCWWDSSTNKHLKTRIYKRCIRPGITIQICMDSSLEQVRVILDSPRMTLKWNHKTRGQDSILIESIKIKVCLMQIRDNTKNHRICKCLIKNQLKLKFNGIRIFNLRQDPIFSKMNLASK